MNKKLEYKRIEQAAKMRGILGKTLVYTLLTVWAVVVLFTFYWMILTSVKSYGAYNSEYIPQFFTVSPTLQNYADAFTGVPLAKYFLNTVEK